MNLNNESAYISVPEPAKRLSFSSRASKIPQKLPHSSFFSLKPTASTMINNNNNNNNDKLSTRISHMLFRQRTTTGSMARESSRSASHSLDYGYNNMDTARSFPSCSLDIPAHEAGRIYNKNSPKSNLFTTPTTTAWDNNQTQASPYSISSPERTDFYSYYYSNGSSTNAADTLKDESNLFSPLSLSNSSVSSFADSIVAHRMTPPLSPMLPMIIKHNTSSTPTCAQYTTKDFANALIDRCRDLLDRLNTSDNENIVAEDIVREMALLSTQTIMLIDACDESYCLQEARNTLEKKDFHVSIKTMKTFLADFSTICNMCLSLYDAASSLSLNTTDDFKKELPKIDTTDHTAKYYQELRPDQIDQTACWFRQHFVGKPYHTYIGSLKQETPANLPLTEPTPANAKKSKSKLNSYFNSITTGDNSLTNDSLGIISVIQERAKDFAGPGNAAAAILKSQYRIIIRSKTSEQVNYVIHECMAKETQTYLERRNESIKLEKCVPPPQHDRRRLFSCKNQSSSSTETHESVNTLTSTMLRAAILSVCPNINLRSFKELSAQSTIMSGLEKDLLKYDEIRIPKHYKFGVLTILDNQTTEEAWFSNTALSPNLQNFLNIMGHKIKLKNYEGYSAGLDTKNGESGESTYVSKWNDFDIMFHVAPLMPKKNDTQQVLRKKHIGNDIVCIIFLEGEHASFNPKAIRSQYIHVYVIIRPEVSNGITRWRIEILTKSNVPEFGPALPSPPLFYDEQTLKEFLTLKLVNAENAALKSEKFFIPNSKARLGLLSTHIQSGLKFNTSQVTSRSANNAEQLTSNKSSSYLPHIKSQPQQQPQQPQQLQQPQQPQKKPQRPKSVNSKSPTSSLGSNASSILLRDAVLEEQNITKSTMASTEIPPLPSISRSSLIHDWKKGFVKNKCEKSITRKTSQLNISSTPMTTADSNQQLESVFESDGSGSHPKKDQQDYMFVGKDIYVSSESFMSTEHLFSATAESMTDDSSTITDIDPLPFTTKRPSAPAHHRFGMKNFPPGTTDAASPNLILSTTKSATTSSISKSNSHVSSLSW